MSLSKNSYYRISKSITNNITIGAWRDFLNTKGKLGAFDRSGQDIDYFISEIVSARDLSLNDLNSFLFDNLLYGKQRSTYIRKYSSSIIDLNDESKILAVVNNFIPIKDNLYYNVLADTSFYRDGKKDELSAFKLVKSKNTIEKIFFIFCAEVEVNLKGYSGREFSYIVVEIDTVRKLIITKVAPKTKLTQESFEPEFLANKYTEMVISLFDLSVDLYVNEHKRVIFNMCSELVKQAFDRMCQTKPKDINKHIDNIEQSLLSVLKIEGIDNKKKNKKIFDIQSNINKYIEHLLISDLFYSAEMDKNVLGVDGLITYIKFTDGKNVHAVVKGQNSKMSIYDSEAFMGLRGPIESSAMIAETHIIWFKTNGSLRLKYDAISQYYLSIHFYEQLSEVDFYNALERYQKFESRTPSAIQQLDQQPTA